MSNKFLSYNGLRSFFSEIKKIFLPKKNPKASGNLELNDGNLQLKTKNKGLYIVDKTGMEYPLIMDNGFNLWIGAKKTAGKHHNGATLISAGYNNTTKKGNQNVFIVIPNDANTSGTEYKIWHAGNYEQFYSDKEVNNNITFPSSSPLFGNIQGSGKTIVLSFLYPILSGTVKFKKLNLQLISGTGERLFLRSGSNGNTYTPITNSAASIINNSSYVRSNEIESIAYSTKPNMGFRITITLKHPLTKSSSSASDVTSPQALTGIFSGEITIS